MAEQDKRSTQPKASPPPEEQTPAVDQPRGGHSDDQAHQDPARKSEKNKESR